MNLCEGLTNNLCLKYGGHIVHHESHFPWQQKSIYLRENNPFIHLTNSEKSEFFTVKSLPEDEKLVLAKDVLVRHEKGLVPLHEGINELWVKNATARPNFTEDSIVKLRYQIALLDDCKKDIDAVVRHGYRQDNETTLRMYSSKWHGCCVKDAHRAKLDKGIIKRHYNDIMTWEQVKKFKHSKNKLGYKFDSMPDDVLVCVNIPICYEDMCGFETETFDDPDGIDMSGLMFVPHREIIVTIILPIWQNMNLSLSAMKQNVVEWLTFIKNQNRKDTLMEFIQNLESFNVYFDKKTGHKVSREAVAGAGFKYCGTLDRVECNICKICLLEWSPNDVPCTEHNKHSKDCIKMRDIFDDFMVWIRQKTFERSEMAEQSAHHAATRGYYYHNGKMKCFLCTQEVPMDVDDHKVWCWYATNNLEDHRAKHEPKTEKTQSVFYIPAAADELEVTVILYGQP